MPYPTPKTETIRQAALRARDGRIFYGTTHGLAYEEMEKSIGEQALDRRTLVEGFETSERAFIGMAEAHKIAERAAQIPFELDHPMVAEDLNIDTRRPPGYVP